MSRLWLLLAVLVGACSSPDLAGTNFHCDTDADCLNGKVCGRVNGQAACVFTTDAPIQLGMTGAFQGPSQDLGTEMRRGILAMLKRLNDHGGIYGRPVALTSLNDNYDPTLARKNAEILLDIEQSAAEADSPDRRGKDSVFALIGNIGTPTMLETAPLATKNRVLYFAPFTGSQRYLRDNTNSPYVYNYRAGYFDETEAMIDYLANYRQPRVISSPPADSYRRVLAFTQKDSYGDAGYEGLVQAYNKLAPLPQPDSSQPNPSIARIYYDRENVQSVEPAIAKTAEMLDGLLAEGAARQSVAVVMVDTYLPGNKFIRGVKDWLHQDAARANGLDIVFLNVSFVGSDSLAAALTAAPETYVDVRDGSRHSYAEGVMVTQVVPYYDTQAVAVSEYRADMAALDGGTHTFTSLEGYVAARLFAKALEANGPSLDTESFRRTLDNSMSNVDIGIGTRLSFSSTNHQASHTVWGSVIQADGSFKVPFSWNPTDRIKPN